MKDTYIPVIFHLLKHPVETDTVLIECDCRDGRNSASSIARQRPTARMNMNETGFRSG